MARLQGGEPPLPHRVLDETLTHVLASMMSRYTMVAHTDHGANQPRGRLIQGEIVPKP